MTTYQRTFIACGAALLLALTAVEPGRASGHRTHLKFTAPVELPGVTLPSGTYIFERLGMQLDVVRVTSADSGRVMLAAFTTPVPQPNRRASDSPVVFAESPEGELPRVALWFPEGSTTGRAFIYD